MTVDLNIRVDQQLAAELRSKAGTSDVAELRRLASEYGVEIVPLETSGFYHADVQDEVADTFAQELREVPGVQAAYVKPPGSSPW